MDEKQAVKTRDIEQVGPLIRRLETDFISGTTYLSKYVTHSLYETLNRISAYLNSTHISGSTDSQGRPKPFFNIVVAVANVWFRATDIDRHNIKLFGRNRKQWINALFANILLQDWMKKEGFGQFLNEWGRVLSRYNSALVKFVENSSGFHASVVNWNRVIVDSVDIDAAPIIEVLELSESQLWDRVDTNGYDIEMVSKLISAKKSRETIGKQTKDNKNDYYKVYEIHGKLSKSLLTDKEEDNDTFVQQMHVMSFVASKNKSTGKKEMRDFTLFRGPESKNPYMLTHLLKEDDRMLAIGPVEYLFDAQWMQNHAAKSVKDHLDIASKLLLQTADSQFLGRNVLTALEHGDVLVYDPQKGPITKVDNMSHDTGQWENYQQIWKNLGNELAGVSEAMLGQMPHSGTAWRLQQMLLKENYSLFELFLENKGLYLEQMIRERILPYLFKKYNTDKEISAILEKNDLDKLDKAYFQAEAIRRVNSHIFDMLEKGLNGEQINPINASQRDQMIQNEQQSLQQQFQAFGQQRFIKPDEVSWKKQFENIEWDIEIDVTGEAHAIQENLDTLNTALKIITIPGFDQNPKAQAIVGRILELAGGISPIEYNALPSAPPPAPQPAAPQGAPVPLPNK